LLEFYLRSTSPPPSPPHPTPTKQTTDTDPTYTRQLEPQVAQLATNKQQMQTPHIPDSWRPRSPSGPPHMYPTVGAPDLQAGCPSYPIHLEPQLVGIVRSKVICCLCLFVSAFLGTLKLNLGFLCSERLSGATVRVYPPKSVLEPISCTCLSLVRDASLAAPVSICRCAFFAEHTHTCPVLAHLFRRCCKMNVCALLLIILCFGTFRVSDSVLPQGIVKYSQQP
jgi:hypothetical protein